MGRDTHRHTLRCTERCTVGRTREKRDPESEQEPGLKRSRDSQRYTHTAIDLGKGRDRRESRDAER